LIDLEAKYDRTTTHNHEILAIILSNRYSAQRIKLFTADEFSQQLAYMNRPKGYEIEPRVHPVPRQIDWTQTEGCGLFAAASAARAVWHHTVLHRWVERLRTAYRLRAAKSRQRAYAEN
jgi:hypothetical protein